MITLKTSMTNLVNSVSSGNFLNSDPKPEYLQMTSIVFILNFKSAEFKHIALLRATTFIINKSIVLNSIFFKHKANEHFSSVRNRADFCMQIQRRKVKKTKSDKRKILK